METIVITRPEMIKILNNHLTGVAENATCGGELEFFSDERFVIFEDFYEGRPLTAKWKSIVECYNLHNTQTAPNWLQFAERDFPNFLLLVTKRILGV
jgi:hypothetical protein